MSVFPVGGLRKEEVREIASQAGFTHVARRKEVRLSPVVVYVCFVCVCVCCSWQSMGLCFIGKRDFPQFISEVSSIIGQIEFLPLHLLSYYCSTLRSDLADLLLLKGGTSAGTEVQCIPLSHNT